MINSCTSAPITERKQLKLIPEAKLNAQAAQIYEKVKEKEKLIKDTKSINEIKEIGKKMEEAISIYFDKSNIPDPTVNFNWEYILIDNDKVKNAWCMPGYRIGGKLANTSPALHLPPKFFARLLHRVHTAGRVWVGQKGFAHFNSLVGAQVGQRWLSRTESG